MVVFNHKGRHIIYSRGLQMHFMYLQLRMRERRMLLCLNYIRMQGIYIRITVSKSHLTWYVRLAFFLLM